MKKYIFAFVVIILLYSLSIYHGVSEGLNMPDWAAFMTLCFFMLGIIVFGIMFEFEDSPINKDPGYSPFDETSPHIMD